MRCLPSLAFFCVSAAAVAAPLAPPSWDQWNTLRGKGAVDGSVQRDGRPAMRVTGDGSGDALIRSAPVALTIGKTYELSGWVRTDALKVQDLGRSPIAVGATLAMASMPFDVHAESLGGTRPWTRVSLRFTATRARDEITLRVAEGGAFTGSAWFGGVGLDEAGPAPAPSPSRRFGPAYRYSKAGWIYLHIEGDSYERGYQHGSLMPGEIARYSDRCAADVNPASRQEAWNYARTVANTVFLRGFDEEMLAEMRGIADGAAAAGCRYNGRKPDLIDIAAANVVVEIGLLQPALRITGTGLEMLGLKPPVYAAANQAEPGGADRCSAFAATGKATRDGHMVIGHTTWWPLTLAEQTNVWLDIQPKRGRRVLMQSYPGGIQSGTDWYQNDAGLVLTETTIRQTPFNPDGASVGYRARRAIQYSTSIDQMVEHLSARNNGLYTNGWLMGDGKTDEIAVLELGTRKSKLWRSSRNEWFAGTEGFYWGNNNGKDLEVRMEAMARDSAEHPAYSPAQRDVKWVELYDQHKGRIDEQFAFLAFRTAPLVSGSAMDAKVVTAAMASEMMVWAAWGKPNQREWTVREWEKRYDKNDGLYASGYTLFHARSVPPPADTAPPAAVPLPAERNREREGAVEPERLWSGIVSPAGEADTWLTAGAALHRALLSGSVRPEVLRADYSLAALSSPEFALRATALTPRSRDGFTMAGRKGALLLAALSTEIGAGKYLALMRDFYSSHAGRTASTAEFRSAAEKAAGRSLAGFFKDWLDSPGLPGGTVTTRYPAMVMQSVRPALIVYGTMAEAGANRHAAELIAGKFLQWQEHSVAIRKDFEVTEAALAGHDVLLIGRPEANSALASLRERLALDYQGAQFRIGGKTYSSEYDGLVLARPNPVDPKHIAIVIAGNSALQTVKSARELPGETEYAVCRDGRTVEAGFDSPR